MRTNNSFYIVIGLLVVFLFGSTAYAYTMKANHSVNGSWTQTYSNGETKFISHDFCLGSYMLSFTVYNPTPGVMQTFEFVEADGTVHTVDRDWASYTFSVKTPLNGAYAGRVQSGSWTLYNVTDTGYTCPKPDYIVTDVHPDIPPSGGEYNVGDNIDWYVTVKNDGGGDADVGSSVGYYLGTSSTDLSNRINSDGTSALNSGESETDHDSYTFTAADVGWRYLICKADYDNDIDESYENNNTNYYGPFEVIPLCTAPPAPTGVSASDGTICGQVSITWSSSGADEYRVYRDGSPIGSWQAGTSYIDNPVDCSTHTYQVKARNTCTGYPESGLSSGDPGSPKCAPPIPTGVSASDGTICDQVSITWNPVSGADDYVVYRDSVQIYTTASTSYTDTPGDCSPHTYQVEAQNSCGPSDLSVGDPGKAMCTPLITLDPVQDPDPVCDGNDVTFTVVATGDSLHYQWKVDDVDVGFDNPSYLWTGVNCSDDGAQIVCEVWNDCDIVTSNAATLYVDCGCLCCHHCDSDCDGRIIISEVTSYGACWKTGCTWPVEPNQIPIGYVTNCGYLWKVGECYDCNDLEVPPQCWQPAICSGGSILMMGGGAAGPVSSSFNPLYYTPETPVEVSTEITPDPGTMVYAVEDAPPTGWTVDSINQSGSWDDVNKKVKWGPFFDANIRTLTYNATPPAAETGEKTFSGTASFDGSDEPFVRTISDVCPLDGVGNLDDDCDVDWFDFAIFVSHWLEGVL